MMEAWEGIGALPEDGGRVPEGHGRPFAGGSVEEAEMQTMLQEAMSAHVRDVWLDGNEEIVEIGATCPNRDCGHPIVTSFTRPRVTTKVHQCRGCGLEMAIVRPAFIFERGAGPDRAD